MNNKDIKEIYELEPDYPIIIGNPYKQSLDMIFGKKTCSYCGQVLPFKECKDWADRGNESYCRPCINKYSIKELMSGFLK